MGRRRSGDPELRTVARHRSILIQSLSRDRHPDEPPEIARRVPDGLILRLMDIGHAGTMRPTGTRTRPPALPPPARPHRRRPVEDTRAAEPGGRGLFDDPAEMEARLCADLPDVVVEKTRSAQECEETVRAGLARLAARPTGL